MSLILRTINPDIIENWMMAVARFSKLLKEAFGGSIVGVYASESPEFGIGDYNVVVVLSTSVSDDIVERVIEIAGEACKRLNVTIVPKVVSNKDIEAIEYMKIFLAPKKPEWSLALKRFVKLLKEAFGGSIVGVYASESPEFGIGDYNVVVVLSTSVSDDIVERVIEIAGEACKRLNVTIVPKVVSNKDIEGKIYVETMEGAGIKIL